MRLRLVFLGFLAVIAIASLAVVHIVRLTATANDPRFVRFMRRYGGRAAAAEKLPPHGTAVDRKGRALDGVVVPGTVFAHVIDELAMAADGAPVRLSLDADLQAAAEKLMSGRNGAVVALEPSTGRIRALVSSPRSASLDRALDGAYPPGSTFKVFIAAAALSAGLDPVFNCPPQGYGNPPIRDVEALEAARKGKTWKGFGRLGMGEALMHSSNVYFAQLGVAFGPERFGKAVEAARLRDPVHVLNAATLRLSASGNGVPDISRAAALAPVAIGQGTLQMSPLSVALVTAAIANDGVMLEPTLSESARPTLRARPFSFDAAGRVKKMMRMVVRSGTGRGCDLRGLDVCGKTGTAETSKRADHSWFTCFAPEKSPRLVVTVLVEHGGFGASSALPVAKGVLREANAQGYFAK